VLYAHSYNREGTEITAGDLLEKDNDLTDRDFFESLVRLTILHTREADELIEKFAKNWELERLARIDKILLRMGVCEFKYFPEIPPKVTLNELIEIAKNFSTAPSSKFVNAILNEILSFLTEQNQINKVGRGTIQESINKPPHTND